MNFPFVIVVTRGTYGARPWHHAAAYRVSPGWYALELGSWHIEAFKERRRVPRWVPVVLAAALLPAPFAYSANGYLNRALADLYAQAQATEPPPAVSSALSVNPDFLNPNKE